MTPKNILIVLAIILVVLVLVTSFDVNVTKQ